MPELEGDDLHAVDEQFELAHRHGAGRAQEPARRR